MAADFVRVFMQVLSPFQQVRDRQSASPWTAANPVKIRVMSSRVVERVGLESKENWREE